MWVGLIQLAEDFILKDWSPTKREFYELIDIELEFLPWVLT